MKNSIYRGLIVAIMLLGVISLAAAQPFPTSIPITIGKPYVGTINAGDTFFVRLRAERSYTCTISSNDPESEAGLSEGFRGEGIAQRDTGSLIGAEPPAISVPISDASVVNNRISTARIRLLSETNCPQPITRYCKVVCYRSDII